MRFIRADGIRGEDGGMVSAVAFVLSHIMALRHRFFKMFIHFADRTEVYRNLSQRDVTATVDKCLRFVLMNEEATL